ncbi:D-hexose-6-phosphate mutarotase [Schaalia sp. JY-X169]|uniref:D-hexose-6-phosphate mutarotase n=1 Tax=Schaalia sp. JY-X169 TaxID=2758572 RepID=UPI0015F627E2|nr:D-hexose-6-phosphate mutarotase [Schaalia sp. JY-X169]
MSQNEDVVAEVETSQGGFAAHSAGGQITRWDSSRFGALLFVSRDSAYGVGSPIRGGIPLCFPWFGALRDEDEGGVVLLGRSRAAGSHGFARNVNWRQTASSVGEDGAWLVRYELSDEDLPDAPSDPSLQPFLATLEAVFSDVLLDLTFTVKNTGADAFWYEEALHTYFAVADSTSTELFGLEGTGYVDKAAGGASGVQDGPVTFGAEVDRVFQSPAALELRDVGNGRSIRIVKERSGATIVWNPGPELARTMSHLGDEEYRDFVCVEAANAAESAVTLQPGEEHIMRVRYEVAAL